MEAGEQQLHCFTDMLVNACSGMPLLSNLIQSMQAYTCFHVLQTTSSFARRGIACRVNGNVSGFQAVFVCM